MSEKQNKKTDSEQKKDKTKDQKETEAAGEEKTSGLSSTWKFIIFAGLIAIVFLSIALVPQYLNKQKFEENKYNHFLFEKRADGFWYAYVQKGHQPYWISFYHHPAELESIGIGTDVRDKFFNIQENNGSIFITFDPDANNSKIVVAGVEISKITGSRYGLLDVNTHSAFIKQPGSSLSETQIPIVTCNSADEDTMVIWLTLSDKNVASSASTDSNCIIVEAKTYDDLIRVSDRLMYQLLGIMN